MTRFNVCLVTKGLDPVFGRNQIQNYVLQTRDEDPTFFSTDPDPAQLKKKSESGSDLKPK